MVLALLVAVEAVWVARARSEAKRATKELAGAQERRGADPAPAAVTGFELGDWQQTEVVTAQRILQCIRASTTMESVEAWNAVPMDRSSALLEITGFIAQHRAKARAAGVELRPGESFGFISHLQTGPETEQLRGVHHQRLAVAAVLDVLWTVRPSALHGVVRERPVSTGQSLVKEQVADFFTPPSAVLTRRSEGVDTVWLRITFEGVTAVLRKFLNALADSPEPLTVRAVEVAAASSDAGLESRPAEPVVPARAIFAVTLEVVPPTALVARLEQAEACLPP